MLIKPRPNIHEPLEDGRTNPSINEHKLYVVAELVMDDVRVVNERGEPILVPLSLFDVLDDWIPDEWVGEVEEDEGWDWCGPPEFAVRGFFERWHDDHPHEMKVFAEVYERLWRHYEKWLGRQEMILKR